MSLKQTVLVVMVCVTLLVSSAYAIDVLEGMPMVTKEPGIFLSTSLDTMKKILMVARQGDEVAFGKILIKGRMDGTIRLCADKETVIYVQKVDKDIMLVRPQGDPQTYYAIRDLFDYEKGDKK